MDTGLCNIHLANGTQERLCEQCVRPLPPPDPFSPVHFQPARQCNCNNPYELQRIRATQSELNQEINSEAVTQLSLGRPATLCFTCVRQIATDIWAGNVRYCSCLELSTTSFQTFSSLRRQLNKCAYVKRCNGLGTTKFQCQSCRRNFHEQCLNSHEQIAARQDNLQCGICVAVTFRGAESTASPASYARTEKWVRQQQLQNSKFQPTQQPMSTNQTCNHSVCTTQQSTFGTQGPAPWGNVNRPTARTHVLTEGGQWQHLPRFGVSAAAAGARAPPLAKPVMPLHSTPHHQVNTQRPALFTSQRLPAPTPATWGTQRATPARFQSLPSFSGLPIEDPTAFLQECTQRLTRYGVDEGDWPSCVGEKLQGVAKEWWRGITHYGQTWGDFCCAFACRFSNTFTSLQSRSKIILAEQKVDESLCTFVTQKINLIKSYHPHMATTEVLEVVASTVRPVFRPALAPLIHVSEEAFLRSAVILDQSDHGTPRNQPRRDNREGGHNQSRDQRQNVNKQGDVNNQDNQPPTINQSQNFGNANFRSKREWKPSVRKNPPYPCRECEGQQMHWRSECPVSLAQQQQQPTASGNDRVG